jgi:hypothetical protein
MPYIHRPTTPVIPPQSVGSTQTAAEPVSIAGERQTRDAMAAGTSAPQQSPVPLSSALTSPRSISSLSRSGSPAYPSAPSDLSPETPIVLENLKEVDRQDHGGVVEIRWSKHPNDAVLRRLGLEHDLVNRYGVGLTPSQRTHFNILTCIQEFDSAQESLTLTRSNLEFTQAQIRAQPFMAFALNGMLPVLQSIITIQENILIDVRPRLEQLRNELPSSSGLHSLIGSQNFS